ncbi:MAG: hypothetical protein PWP52_2345 [Bacteroidales bacterium]|nr:hypothetical protein [Bacteroidales bacterium]
MIKIFGLRILTKQDVYNMYDFNENVLLNQIAFENKLSDILYLFEDILDRAIATEKKRAKKKKAKK